MNILIVDDEVIAVKAIKANIDFGLYGIEGVFTANSMRQAQQVIWENKVEIMLCDIEMPNGSGLELIKWAKEHDPDMVCIILSCHSDFSFAQRAIDLSCLQYILKPATAENLGPALAKAVKQIRRQESDTNMKKIGEGYLHNLAGEEEADASRIQRACQYIMEHVSEEITVKELAVISFLSQSQLVRCFKKEYGKTVVEYLMDYRIRLAEQLLRETDLTVTAVSAKVGYPNYAYFTKLFKKSTGYTPSKYKSVFGKGVQDDE